MTATITVTAGCFLRRAMRNKLVELKFKGQIDDFLETKEFLESDFTIKCSTEVAYIIKDWIEKLQ